MSEESSSSSPPPTGPPGASPSAEGSAEGEKLGANLSHFKKRQEDPPLPPPKESVSLGDAAAGVAEKVGGFVGDIKEKAAASRQQPGATGRYKKLIILAVVLLVVAPIAVTIAVNIPSQIQRSKAFALYEDGDYELALAEFGDYLNGNPGDNEAAFYAAQSAMRLEKYEQASPYLMGLDRSDFRNNPDFLFSRALAALPTPEVESLTRLVSASPDHVGGRFLRGVLLVKDGDAKRARADFLRADSVIRGEAEFDNQQLLAAHRRLSKYPSLLPVFDLESSPADAVQAAMQDLTRRLNVIPAYGDFYINRYFPLLPTDPAADGFPDDAVVSMYYTLLLLQQRELDEAGVEISKLPRAAMDGLTGALPAIRHAMRGDYAQALPIFQAVADNHSDNPRAFFNLANAAYSAAKTPDDLAAAAAALDKTLELDPAMQAARHNRAFLRMLQNDLDGAREDLAAMMLAEEESESEPKPESESEQEESKPSLPPKSAVLQAMASLAEEPAGDDNGKLYTYNRGDYPGIAYLQAAHSFSQGAYDNALSLLADEAGNGGDAAMLYARRLADFGLVMRARTAARPHIGNNSEAAYFVAKMDAAAGDWKNAQLAISGLTENAARRTMEALILRREKKDEDALSAARGALSAAADSARRRELALDVADIYIDAEVGGELATLFADSGRSPAESALLFHLQADPALEAEAMAAMMRHPVYFVQYHTGMGLAAIGKPAEALEVLQQAAVWQPTNTALLETLIQLQTDAGNEEVAADLRRRVENINNHAENLTNPDNKETYAVDIPKERPELRRNIIKALNNSASPAAALAQFETILKETWEPSERAKTRFQRGSFYLLLKNYPAAAADLQAAGTEKEFPLPQRVRALLYLGKALSLQRQHLSAAKVYRLLSSESPGLPLYRRLEAQSLSRAGESKAAVRTLERTFADFPADVESYLAAAAIHKQQYQPEEAAKVLRLAARVAPLYAPVYRALSAMQALNENTFAAKENSNIVLYLTERK